MGAPLQEAAEDQTEVWSFASGNDRRTVAYGTVSVVMVLGRVSQVSYSGPTGGLLTGGEQCAFAVQNCVPR